MKRATELLLRVGLLLGALAASGQLVVMILALLPGGPSWHWAGSLAFFAATVSFALAMRLLDMDLFRNSPEWWGRSV